VAIAKIQDNNGDSGFTGAASRTSTFPSACTPNTVLVAMASIGANTTITMSDPVNGSWTPIGSRYWGNVGYTVAMFWVKNTASSAVTATAAFGASGAFGTIQIAEFSGLATVNALEVFSGGKDNGATTAPNDVAMTTVNPGDLILSAIGSDGQVPSAGSGFALTHAANSTSCTALEYQVQSSAGSITPSWSLPSAVQAIVVSAALVAAPPSGGTSYDLDGTSDLTLAATGDLGVAHDVSGQSNLILVRTGAMDLEFSQSGDTALSLALAGDLGVTPPGSLDGDTALSLAISGDLVATHFLDGDLGLALTTSGDLGVVHILDGDVALSLSMAGDLTVIPDLTLVGNAPLSLAATGTFSVEIAVSGDLALGLSVWGSFYENLVDPDSSIQDAGLAFFGRGLPGTPSRADAELAYYGGTGSVADAKRAALESYAPGGSLADMERAFYPEEPTPTASLGDSKLDYWRKH